MWAGSTEDAAMGFDEHTILDRVLIFLPVLLSLSVHECAHAWAAWRLGDDTARLMGRLTLNPLAHIDPVGTELLPLLGVPFGWAKPVPVNPLRFTRRVSMKTGMLLVAVAGPLSNVAIALLSTIILGLAWRFYPNMHHTQPGLFGLLNQLALVNVVLAVFNLFPVPPLDGSRVADALMPRPWRPLWDRFCSLGYVPLAAVIVLPLFLGFDLLGPPVRFFGSLLVDLLVWLSR